MKEFESVDVLHANFNLHVLNTLQIIYFSQNEYRLVEVSFSDLRVREAILPYQAVVTEINQSRVLMTQIFDKEKSQSGMQATIKLLTFDLTTKCVQKIGKIELTGSEIELPDEKKYRSSPSLLLLVNLPILYFDKYSLDLQRATFKVIRLLKNSNELEVSELRSCSIETLVKELIELSLSSRMSEHFDSRRKAVLGRLESVLKSQSLESAI